MSQKQQEEGIPQRSNQHLEVVNFMGKKKKKKTSGKKQNKTGQPRVDAVYLPDRLYLDLIPQRC